ncbi:hypothetical protein [Kineococcus sp. SYSU DK005]|uniref:hypothetical protein n=1 Tax=Kineococcus sp. SYSU DK005 TaxID=3383126 RepID=UPI003D7D2453
MSTHQSTATRTPAATATATAGPAPSRPTPQEDRTSTPGTPGTPGAQEAPHMPGTGGTGAYVVAATGGYREPRFFSTADRAAALARYERWADEADPWTGERVDLLEVTGAGCRSLLQNTGTTAPPF